VREGPCAFGDFVFAVFDFDELFVFVVVCVAVLDDEPPGEVWSVWIFKSFRVLDLDTHQ
jgi:hypothetical protein